MADKKITDLTAAAALKRTDVLPVVADPGGSAVTKQVTLASLARHTAGGEYNVLAYGAKGDGVTDDSLAIQAAIDAAEVTGGEVYFPRGNYLVSTTLTIAADNITIAGAGQKSSRISGASAVGANPVVKAGLASGVLLGFVAHDLMISATHDDGIVLEIDAADSPVLTNVFLAGNNAATNAQRGLYLSKGGSYLGALQAIAVSVNYLKFPVEMTDTVAGCAFSNCNFASTTSGAHGQAGSVGVKMPPGAGGSVSGNMFSACQFAKLERGLLITGYGTSVLGCRFENVDYYAEVANTARQTKLIPAFVDSEGEWTISNNDTLLFDPRADEIWLGGEQYASLKSGAAGGPTHRLYNPNVSASAIAAWAAPASGDTDAFGEALTGAAIVLAAMTGKCKVGTVGSAALELIHAGAVRAKTTTTGLEIPGTGKGLILTSPDGTRYLVRAENGGTLSLAAL